MTKNALRRDFAVEKAGNNTELLGRPLNVRQKRMQRTDKLNAVVWRVVQ